MSLPILYSLRNCPYAMRARMAIFKSQQAVILRDLVLSNKPKTFLEASPKATVPVVVLPNNEVIDESLDVMLWALHTHDPDNLLRASKTSSANAKSEILALIQKFDDGFKPALEAYKCAKRYHESNLIECRLECEKYIKNLEERLNAHIYLLDNNESMADIALLPFIRQFAKVERSWYLQSPYPKLKQWLNSYLQSLMFSKVMTKHPLYKEGDEPITFGNV